ncbi:hypothetical protein FRC18_010870 [Serendipita sp. 400]|nr:hypothetical protein FRC18_010870 [Serendipita sp. 400]
MHSLWVFLALNVVLTVSGMVLVNAAGTVFVRPQIRVTTTFSNFEARIMDHWGGGGGNEFFRISDSKHPFEGRRFGGAKRKEIRGTREFGSGYPYGASNQSTIAGRPFPFGVWPLYWDQNFMNSSEYGPQYDAIRPGGFLVYAPLRTTQEHFNVTENEVYYAIGDRDSLLLIMISYVTWCHVTPAWPSKFDPTSPNSTIKLENVIQYFRASSFALSSPAYSNAFARISYSDTKDSTPLPETMEHSPFRKCVDEVTENALAIVNKPPGPKLAGILLIVFLSTWPFALGALGWTLFGTFYILRATRRWLWSGPFEYLSQLQYRLSYMMRYKLDARNQEMEARRQKTEAIKETRRQELAYEWYP